MPKRLLIAIALLIVAGFLVFTMTYTVRYTEAAVVTTFGKADENSVVTEPGLKFPIFPVFNSVTKYDTRARFIEPAAETFSTADQRQLVIQGFLTWRVADPLAFYNRHRGEAGSSINEHYRIAENNLRSRFRSALAELSGFTSDELFSAETGASKLLELEQAILENMRNPADASVAGVSAFGVEVDLVGITSIEFPQSVSQEVFGLMQGERNKVASEAEAEGVAEAANITASARNDAERILEFARLRAGELRNKGELEAANWLAQRMEEPELAAFLQRLELFEGLGKRATLVLPTSMYGMEVFDLGEMRGLINEIEQDNE